MLIEIGGVHQYYPHTWGDATGTWESMLNVTWYDVFIGGAPNLMINPQPQVHLSIDKRNTAQFTLIDVGALHHFARGQEVIINTNAGYRIFGGFIDSITETLVNCNNVIKHEISCTDYHYLADKRIVAKAWTNTTIEDIVQYVLDYYLAAEGVTEGSIQVAGPVTQYVANYVPASDVLTDMSARCGYIWWIDEYKELYFVARGTYSAEWELIENDTGIVEDAQPGLTVARGNPEYRNKQFLLGPSQSTVPQTEIQFGDGEKTTFPVGYKISEEPDVWVSTSGGAYVQKTVGAKGVTADTKDWYWADGDNTVMQDYNGTKLTKEDKVKIVYIGKYPIVVVSTNFSEIAARKLVEGIESSGIVECSKSDNLLTTRDAAIEEVNALLNLYAAEGTKIQYTTIRDGLAAGVMQPIKITAHNIDEDYLISSIDIKYSGEIDYYDVTAFVGPLEDDWDDIFMQMTTLQKKLLNPENVGTSEVVLVLYSFSKTWTNVESPNIWLPCYANGSTTPGSVTFPCFEDGDRIKYLSLRNNGVELYRMYRTDQTSTSNTILTTFIVASESANFEVDQAVLVGGDSATLTFGTGLDLEIHSFPYIKNNLESIELQFTSLKWS